jgi:hypothetical protein
VGHGQPRARREWTFYKRDERRIRELKNLLRGV